MLDAIAPKRKGQQYIMFNIEPNIIEHRLLTGELPTKDHELDLLAYITRDADIPLNYFGAYSNYTVHSFFSPPPPKQAKPEWNVTSPVLYLSSNCVKSRDDYVRELMKYIAVDSYGKCLHNKDFPEDLLKLEGGVGSHGWKVKEELIARYKFVLAFENSVYEDYVSEKFFQPLVQGSVPIYRGAPNMRQGKHLLFPHSAIEVTGFQSPEELAKYLLLLDGNDRLYAEYFAWKRYGPTRQVLDAAHRYSLASAPCRVCEAVRDRRRTIG